MRNYSHQKNNLRVEHQFINQILNFRGKDFEFEENRKSSPRFQIRVVMISRVAVILPAAEHRCEFVFPERIEFSHNFFGGTRLLLECHVVLNKL